MLASTPLSQNSLQRPTKIRKRMLTGVWKKSNPTELVISLGEWRTKKKNLKCVIKVISLSKILVV